MVDPSLQSPSKDVVSLGICADSIEPSLLDDSMNTKVSCAASVYAQSQDKVASKEEDLSHDVGSGSDITPCNKIDKPLVVYRFTGNLLTSVTMLHA